MNVKTSCEVGSTYGRKPTNTHGYGLCYIVAKGRGIDINTIFKCLKKCQVLFTGIEFLVRTIMFDFL